MVPTAGIEPARLSPLPPQDSVSTKFHHVGIKALVLHYDLLFGNTVTPDFLGFQIRYHGPKLRFGSGFGFDRGAIYRTY